MTLRKRHRGKNLPESRSRVVAGPLSVESLPSGRFHGQSRPILVAPGVSVSESRYQCGDVLSHHRHEKATLCVVIEGHCRETHCTGEWEGGAWTVAYRAPGEVHANRFGTSARCLAIELDPPSGDATWECIHMLPAIRHLLTPRSAGIAARLDIECRENDSAASTAVKDLILLLLSEVAGRWSLSRGKPPVWLLQARELLRSCYTESHTHSTVAATVGVHPTTLIRGFERHYGCTPGEYVRQLRIRTACEMLANTDASLSEIALRAGYYDQSHFTNAFSRLTGLTPTSYRRKRRVGEAP